MNLCEFVIVKGHAFVLLVYREIFCEGYVTSKVYEFIYLTCALKRTPCEFQISYVRWLWCGRLGLFVTLLQLVAAVYLTLSLVNSTPNSKEKCHKGF